MVIIDQLPFFLHTFFSTPFSLSLFLHPFFSTPFSSLLFSPPLVRIMPLGSQRSQVIKRPKPQQIFPCILSITVQSISTIILPSLFNYQLILIRTSTLTRKEYVDEVLNCKNLKWCQKVLKLKLEVFIFFAQRNSLMLLSYSTWCNKLPCSRLYQAFKPYWNSYYNY